MKKLSNFHGFTLVELTVVLAVISIILGSAITMFTASLESRSYNATVSRLDTLKQALINYRLAYNRLPCPAANFVDPAAVVLVPYVITDANFGIEAATTGNCAGGAPAADKGVAGAATGMIPVRTLGLPDDMAFDSWGRRIRYTVAPAFVATDAFSSIAATDATTRMTVINNDSSVVLTDKAVFTLLSGGVNGHGMRGGMTGTLINAAMTNTNELLNCKCNSDGTMNGSATFTSFAQGIPKQDTSSAVNSFDDQLVFATRLDLRNAAE